MAIRLHERELNKIGFVVDAGDPEQLVPIKNYHDSLPSESWDLERLALYARIGFDEAERLEIEALALARRSTVHVYRAGHALCIARDRLKPEGRWCAWQDEHSIPRTSAWEAIELYKRAESEEVVAHLTRSEAKERYGIYPTNGNGQTAEHPKERDADVVDGTGKKRSPKSVAYWERAADVESNTTKGTTQLPRLQRKRCLPALCGQINRPVCRSCPGIE